MHAKGKECCNDLQKYTSSVTRVFSEGEFLNGESGENLKQGLKYSYYEGVWNSVPDLSKLTPKSQGIVESPDLKFTAKKDSFAVRFEGYLKITKKICIISG